MQIAREQTMRFLSAAGLCVVVLSLSAKAATIAVPSVQPTIQAGIDAAVNGDTVLIADGTYTGVGNYNMDFAGKRIVVKSQNGPANCVIDCELVFEPARFAFRFHSQEDTSAQLLGLTIRNATGIDSAAGPYFGSVICLNGSAPMIRECRFENNWGNYEGGAIYANGSALYLIDCEFYHNGAHNGGGVFCDNSPFVLIQGCRFEANAARIGGAISFVGIALEIVDCDFISNRAEAYAAIQAYAGTTISVVSSHFVGSDTEGPGTIGIGAGDSVVIDRTIILSNHCTGTFMWTSGDTRIRKSVIAGNRTLGWMDGPLFSAGDLQFDECTLVGNRAGHGPLIESNSLRLMRSVVAFNEPWSQSAGDSSLIRSDSVTVECVDLFGNSTGDWADGLLPLLGMNGNVSKDPLFCDTAQRNYFLIDASPCLPESTSCGLMGALPVGCGGPVLMAHYLEDETPDHVVSHTPTFGWSRSYVFAQSEYEIEVGYDNDWTMAEQWQPGAVMAGDTSVVYSGMPLVDGLAYHSRVRIGHDGIWSNWLETSLRMNTIPAPPIQLSPTGLGEVHQNPPQLTTIIGQDDEGDLQRVQMAVIQDDSILVDASPLVPSSPVPVGDTVKWTGSIPLVENGSYIWTARATDGYETTGYWSAWTPFYVNSVEESPSAPVPVAPIGDPIIYTQFPSYVWTHSSDPDPMDTVRYDFETANDSAFVFTFDTLGLQDTSFVVPTALELGRRFGWTVSGRDNHLLSAASESETFRTYKPGDVNASWTVTTADIIQLVNYVFKGEPLGVPPCVAMVNDGDVVNATDIIYLVNYVLKGGPEPLAACN